MGFKASAFLDVLVRAQLPARLAFAEGPDVHSSIDACARMANLVKSYVLKVEGLTRFQNFCLELVIGNGKNKSHFVSRLQNGHDMTNTRLGQKLFVCDLM